MSGLPSSWELASVSDVATIQLGRQRSPKNHTGPNMRPYLRSANVTWRGIDVSDVKEMNFDPTEAATFELQHGDILLNEASGSPGEVGKPAIWRNEIPGACFQNTLLRVRSTEMDEDYLFWYFYNAAFSGQFGEAGRGVNIRHLGKRGLSKFPIPVPPLAEQRRIVAAIEEHLSRLGAADTDLATGLGRLERLQASALLALIGPAPTSALKNLSTGMRYGTSVKCSYDASGPAVLRIPNVSAGRLSMHDLKYATDTVSSSAFAHPGEILFVRTNGSRGLIGRTACVPDGPPHAFASYLIGMTLDETQAHPEYVNQVMESPNVRRQVVSAASTSAGQYNLSIGKIGAIQIPLPELNVQREVVEQMTELRIDVERLRAVFSGSARRALALRRSILVAAFSGQLVSQDPADDPASALIDRISKRTKAAS